MTISIARKEYRRDQVLSSLDPLVADWLSQFPNLTPSQKYAIPLILDGTNTLIASPTGSGKTLSAFLGIISELVKLAKQNALEQRVYCIYVSPLRSLNNDIQKNLLLPLRAIIMSGKVHSEGIQEIRVSVRTGDTSTQERVRMLAKPPHILITTPESLAIMITAPKFKYKLIDVQWVIVDEIHEVCSSKRGVHLSLTLERLQNMISRPICRIGLSATIQPLDDVARFLVGYEGGKERDCVVVDTRFAKPISITVSSPVIDLIHTSPSISSAELYGRMKDLVTANGTTLIFTNTRAGAERSVFQLSKGGTLDADELSVHHGSLSRDLRKEVEDRLKEGKMRAVVTSTSLELGIDIGSIDLVIQVGSPKSIARCLQRVGRAGHALDRISKGVLIAMERDDLVENAVIAEQATQGKLDRIYIPKNCLDVLSQHIVGMVVERSQWTASDVFNVIRGSFCYRSLLKTDFLNVLKYLSGGYQSLEGFRVYGKIWYDKEEGTLGRRAKLLRVIYATNIGTIPDEVTVRVYLLSGKWIGTIDETFLERLSKGDIFLLGGRTYEFRAARGFKAYVVRKEGTKPTVPSWFSDMLPLSFDLGEEIGQFRDDVYQKLLGGASDLDLSTFISKRTNSDNNAATAISGYFRAQFDFLRTMGLDSFPTHKVIVVEDYRDFENRQNIIFNCTYGRRINDALSRAYAHMVSVELSIGVTVTVRDSGFMLTLPEGSIIHPQKLVDMLQANQIRPRLLEAIKKTEIVKRRFRHCATRALMMLKHYKGREIRIARRQMNAQLLIPMLEALRDFPILKETYREVIEDVMDVSGAESILTDVQNGVRRIAIGPTTDVPSPFSHELIASGFSDQVLMLDRKNLLEHLHESVLRRINADRG